MTWTGRLAGVVAQMQRNWIGRSDRRSGPFGSPGGDIEVFTTRPDTLFGATYVVLAPEHPLVDTLTADPGRTAPRRSGPAEPPRPRKPSPSYREATTRRSELERQTEGRDKTGVFTGAYAVNPVSGEPVPIFVADHVLMGYGTGAIMAVPAHDQRDLEFAQRFGLPVIMVVEPPAELVRRHGIGPDTPLAQWPEAYADDGRPVASTNAEVSLDGLGRDEAKARITDWLEAQGRGGAAVTYKLRDWLFSRQRYWGEPFPIVYDEHGLPIALPESMLPVELPESERLLAADVRRPGAADSEPEPPLSRLADWVEVELDLGDGPQEVPPRDQHDAAVGRLLLVRDPLPGPDELRAIRRSRGRAVLDGPDRASTRPAVSICTSAASSRRCCTCCTRGSGRRCCSTWATSRPPSRSRGCSTRATSRPRRTSTSAASTCRRPRWWRARAGFSYEGRPVTREFGKMGKSLKNSVTPDEMYAEYGADTLRLYEMFSGPLEQSRPWDTKAVVGVYRLLQRIWRNVDRRGDRRGPGLRRAADRRGPAATAPDDRGGARGYGVAAVQHGRSPGSPS